MVLEGCRVGSQTTSRSTAKITAQHSLIYRQLIDHFGQGLARADADVDCIAVEKIGEWIRSLVIDGDYGRKAAHAYSCDPQRTEDRGQEAEAARATLQHGTGR
jgi:hypothetical protein